MEPFTDLKPMQQQLLEIPHTHPTSIQEKGTTEIEFPLILLHPLIMHTTQNTTPSLKCPLYILCAKTVVALFSCHKITPTTMGID